MAKLGTFHFITLDGYYKDDQETTSWHQHDKEGNAFAEENLKSESILVFGRVTYEQMFSYWTSPQAAKASPEVAEAMSRAEKIVFSKTLKKAEWKNTRLINSDMTGEIKKLKRGSKDLVILGSGSIVGQLVDAKLVDSFGIMIDPVAIGSGTPLFNGVSHPVHLKLSQTRVFKNGAVLLTYLTV